MKKIAILLLNLFRFKIDLVNIPPETKKCVFAFAPHTSWTDFVIGKLAFVAMGVKVVFLIKKEAFFFPLNYILYAVGGYPVDRKNAKRFTDSVANIIKKEKEIGLLIAPEGTRKYVTTWKKGFYYIATKAEVPIILCYIDYRSRCGGIGPVFYPTGDYEQDLPKIQQFFYGMKGIYKGAFHLENFE
jgi:1-acyl-sn-glycerol-3-phosphate acyltransferase